jgi:hypothetical protein
VHLQRLGAMQSTLQATLAVCTACLREGEPCFAAIKIKNPLKSKAYFNKKISKVSEKAKNAVPHQSA